MKEIFYDIDTWSRGKKASDLEEKEKGKKVLLLRELVTGLDDD
jgi:hypothetical protein